MHVVDELALDAADGRLDVQRVLVLGRSPAEVLAYVTNSSIDAARDLKITALEDATITSRVKADSQALSVGFGAVGAAVAGADSENKIKID